MRDPNLTCSWSLDFWLAGDPYSLIFIYQNTSQENMEPVLKHIWFRNVSNYFKWYQSDTIWSNFNNPNLAKYPLGAFSRPPRGGSDSCGFSRLFFKWYQFDIIWNNSKHFKIFQVCFKHVLCPSCMPMPLPRYSNMLKFKWLTPHAADPWTCFHPEPLCFEDDSEALPPLLARLVFFCILRNICEARMVIFLERRGPFSFQNSLF